MVSEKGSDRIIKETGLITPREAVSQNRFIRVQSVQNHTFLIGLKEVIPEDILWRREHPRVPSLICFEEDRSCVCPWGCVMKFVQRCVWLFRSYPSLKQVFVLFNREEKNLRRKYHRRDRMAPDLTEDDFPDTVPRVKLLYIPRDFANLVQPYRLFAANYNGLRLVLSNSEFKEVEVPLSFW